MLVNAAVTLTIAGSPTLKMNCVKQNDSQLNIYSFVNTPYILNKSISSIKITHDSSIVDINYNQGDVMSNLISFNKFQFGDIVLELKKPLYIQYTYDESGFYAENEKFEIYCYGKTKEDLIKEINENLIVSWKLYVNCNINELSKDAIEFRAMLNKYIKKV